MNRRDFIKLTLLGISAMYMPKGKPMLLKTIFEKIGRSANLNAMELQEFAMFGDRLQNLEAFVGGMQMPGDGLDLRNPTVSNPTWATDPLQTLLVRRTTPKAVANNTDYAIEFEEAAGQREMFSWDAADPTKIFISPIYSTMPFTVKGNVYWEQNGSGFRRVNLQSYDKDDNIVNTVILAAVPPCPAGVQSVLPFAYTRIFFESTSIAYIKLLAYQNSGGSLNFDASGVQVSVG